jgi:hypothetical protein
MGSKLNMRDFFVKIQNFANIALFLVRRIQNDFQIVQLGNIFLNFFQTLFFKNMQKNFECFAPVMKGLVI